MTAYPVKNLMKEMNRYMSWGFGRIASNYYELNYTVSNIRNEFQVSAEGDYNNKGEFEISYNRYLNDFVRLYAGVNTENESPNAWLGEMNTVALAGVKYFSPYMFYMDVSLDNQLRPRFKIDRELLLFPRIFLEGEFEYRADFGWMNNLENNATYSDEVEWMLGASYMLSRNFSLHGNYNNQYGWGGGLLLRF